MNVLLGFHRHKTFFKENKCFHIVHTNIKYNISQKAVEIHCCPMWHSQISAGPVAGFVYLIRFRPRRYKNGKLSFCLTLLHNYEHQEIEKQ